MNIKTIFSLTLLSLAINNGSCKELESLPKNAEIELITLNYKDLQQIKTEIKARRTKYTSAYDRLLRNASSLLAVTPEKVTDGDLPPSGDKHDFFSIGKYSWPNPDTPDGMPYIRGDGRYNKEAFGERYDLTRFEKTVKNVNTLSLAWFYTGDERYADKAGSLLRTWFIDTDTRMNPNLKNASALPGVYDGMAAGIIFSVVLIEMVDYVKLLSASESWSDADDQQLKTWFADYTTWLMESEFGKKERDALNNHGTWYAAQVAAFSIYSGDIALAKEMIDLAKKQISQQIVQDGSLPREVSRPDSFGYSLYGTRAFVTVASCADYLGEDLWNYKTSNGKGIRQAVGFLVPYLLEEQEWTKGPFDQNKIRSAYKIIRPAAKVYQDVQFTETLNHIEMLHASDNWIVWLTGI